MALQYSLTLDSGISLPSSYARISGIRHTHNETTVDVQSFATAQARLDLKPTVTSNSYSIPWADSVSLTDAYTALKSFPEFSTATDV